MDILPVDPLKSPGVYAYERHIDCIGVDGLRHICKPDENICFCGVKVKSKKLGKKDWERFGCYECTY